MGCPGESPDILSWGADPWLPYASRDHHGGSTPALVGPPGCGGVRLLDRSLKCVEPTLYAQALLQRGRTGAAHLPRKLENGRPRPAAASGLVRHCQMAMALVP
jgi:hypothetical protein